MTIEQGSFRHLVSSDLYRYYGRVSLRLLVGELLLGVGYKYIFWMRLARHLDGRSWVWWPVSRLARLLLRRYRFKFGIEIPFRTDIGPGFYIGHSGGIVVTPEARIGRNCNLSHDVTIGVSNRGERKGAPAIGDNVYIGPGAKLFGGIHVGNDAAIGANCVVTRDVPERAVVVGVPGRVISLEGSAGYVNRTDYDRCR